VTTLVRDDVERLVRFAGEANDSASDELLTPELLVELGRIVSADLVTYCDRDRESGEQVLVTRPGESDAELGVEPEVAAEEARAVCAAESPIYRRRLAGEAEAMMLSDFFTLPSLRRSRFWATALRPYGMDRQLNLGLPVDPSRIVRLMFDRSGCDFSERDRLVLDVLQPELARLWRRARARRLLSASLSGLTGREREVLGLVANGNTNTEIAQALWLSPGTVRKHLENVFAKLGVHTRTAAAARLRGA
jgi:DNA-binding CsgD family transcriptional regulator